MRWRSRRSMLELDLYFERFIQSGKFDALGNEELNYYGELLQMDDNDLLLLFQGEATLADKVMQGLVNAIGQRNK